MELDCGFSLGLIGKQGGVQMMKYVGALAVLALAPTAASATVVTIDYITDTGPTSGKIVFNTETAKVVGTRNNGFFVSTFYQGADFTSGYTIDGETYTTPLTIETFSFFDVFYYARFNTIIADAPIQYTFAMQFSDPFILDVPDYGYETANFAYAEYVDTRSDELIQSINVAYAVSYVNSVPEPATWIMMISGFAAVGGALRRRKSVLVAVAA